MSTEDTTLNVGSDAFAPNGKIPKKYTCEGENINPPISISAIPEDAVQLALIMEDPDAPNGTFDHWIVWNIPPDKAIISENSKPGISGKNSAGDIGYMGPCPPNGSHRYFFKAFALNVAIDPEAGADKAGLMAAMKGHIIARGELIAHYQKEG